MKIVKIVKKQNPLKSIAENCSSLLECIWIVCTTPELDCGGVAKVSEHPVLIQTRLNDTLSSKAVLEEGH